MPKKKPSGIQLSPAAREERAAYLRAWRAANRDRKRESDRRYWEKRAALRKEEIENA